MNKILSIIIIIMSICYSNIIRASHETGTSRLISPNIILNNTLYIQDNKFPSILGATTISSWGFYDKSFSNKVILGIDRYKITAIDNFVATVTLEIKSYLPLALGGGFTTTTKVLTISYEGKNDHQSTTSHASNDQQIYTFTNGYAVQTKITGISVSVNGGAITTNMPNNVYLELQTDAERYYTLRTDISPLNSADFSINYIPASDEFEVSWAKINGAEEYDLEWIWLDAYRDNTIYGKIIDFKNNSTRIRTSQQSYRISNIFEKGQLFFRIRGVGKSSLTLNGFDKTSYSPWTWQDYTSIPLTAIFPLVYNNVSSQTGIGSSDNLFYLDIDGFRAYNGSVPPIHESNKNWQYKATYAEEGKKKEVISYFDGTLRNRQSVTKTNSDNNAIVGETYYDYNGRAAVQALPVPVADATIKFYQYSVIPTTGGTAKLGFNFEDATKNPYSKVFFDKDNASASATICNVEPAGLNNGYGSANYYSPLGTNFFTQLSQGYVPDAEHFPISQTEFTNDNTGRIAKQSGVGNTHKIGSGHETKYFYGSPEQVELDRLFGSEVGNNLHYKKNMVVDANGQVSISYLDQQGRTIATALTGQNPSNLTALKDKTGASLYAPLSAQNSIDADLLNKINASDYDTDKDNNISSGNALTFSKQILVATAQTYTISYDLQGTSYTYSCLPTVACYDCVYDLEINILDKCLNNPTGFTKITKTLGNIINPSGDVALTTNTVCGDQIVNFNTSQFSASGNQLLVDLNVGEYTIIKTLKINQEALTFYLNSYLSTNCVKDTSDFYNPTGVDTSGCNITCAQCVEALGSLSSYTASGKGTSNDYWEEYRICNEPCEYISLCDAEYQTLLSDVSPGGQYAEWQDNTGICNPSIHNLSVFNESNQLPVYKKINSAVSDYDSETPNWRAPKIRNSNSSSSGFSTNYVDEDGTLSYITVTRTSTTGPYFPPVLASVVPTPLPGTSTQFTVLPQNLANVADFISNWKSSWAASLVFYHPEYPYYDWCLKNSTETIASPYSVSVMTGTTLSSSNIATSDNYDSLLLSTDDITSVISADLNKFTDNLNNDPYWNTTSQEIGVIYNIAHSLPQFPIISKSPQKNTNPTYGPWNVLYPHAGTRISNYRNSGTSLSLYAAIITTSCSILYGQPIATQIACLSSAYPGITSTSSPSDIISILPTALKNKYWDTYRMLYLALKQEMQQESAESYVMNSDKYRGCNDCIGDPAFDPTTAFGVPFADYLPLTTGIFGWSGFLNANKWYNPFTFSSLRSQYCGWLNGGLYKTKIKRFSNSKAATDLQNTMSAGDPGASIYASTGLCPNAFYLQGLISSLGSNNQLTSSTLNLSTIPEFNTDLFKVVAGGIIPTTFTPANWTASYSGKNLTASMQIGTNPACPFTLNLPSTYTIGTAASPTTIASPFTYANTGSSSSTYAFLKLYRMVPTTSSGGTYNFTVWADITNASGSTTTYTTVILNGNTCIPLTGCSFNPPCEPTTSALYLQKLLNAIASTGNFCATTSAPLPMTDLSVNPVFVNTFAPILGTGTWNWAIDISAPNSFKIYDNGSSSNSIKVTFNNPMCPTPGSIFSFANITGRNSGASNFNIRVNSATATTSVTSGVSTYTTWGTATLNGQPLTVGNCNFDIAKCNTIPHQTREDMETFLSTSTTPGLLNAPSSNLTSNYNFGFNLRDQLAASYQTTVALGSSATVNPLYYYWQKTALTAANTILTGSFFASTITPIPALPASACGFTLAFANPTLAIANTHDFLNTYSLSNFVLDPAPIIGGSVYNFKVTATISGINYILNGTSSCFGMRACSDCVSPVPGGQISAVILNNTFECSANPPFSVTGVGGTSVLNYTANPSANCLTTDNLISQDNHFSITKNIHFVAVSSATLNWPGYNNGSSLFIGMHSSMGDDVILTHTVSASNRIDNCQQFYVKFKSKWYSSATGLLNDGNPYIVTSNGVSYYTCTTNTLTPSDWIELTFGPFTNINGVPNVINIFSNSNSTLLLAGFDDINVYFPTCEGLASLPCVNQQDDYESFPEIEYEDPCVQYALDIEANDASEKYNYYLDSLKTNFVQGYIKKCMGNAIENLHMKYKGGDYQYTLYYYDQAGNLVRTVPPEGVFVETTPSNLTAIKIDRANHYPTKTYYTAHTLSTTYSYNTLNQLVKQETPDAGKSLFWYDKLGRLVASQNAQQKNISSGINNYYSYTKYDNLGRIAEVGQMVIANDLASLPATSLATSLNPASNDYPDNITVNKTEVTNTYYGDDANFSPLLAGGVFTSGSQDYLRSRVASVTIEEADDGIAATYNHATHYSYDVHGNVKELIQENPTMTIVNQKYKKVNYDYDLISGKVNQVVFQPGAKDMFMHRYEYDADNRITNVYTSNDNVIWQQDAKYFYYLHGPMSRVEIGHDKVQATDYAYTIQGWIKGVNSNILNAANDIGKDGNSTTTFPPTGSGLGFNYINAYNARDAFAYSLTYFNSTTNKDYKAINGTTGTTADFVANTSAIVPTPDLFNGNIRQMVTTYLDANAPSKTYTPLALLKNYTYDQLNRITTANANNSINLATNSWNTSATVPNIYNETFSYDQNGNILNTTRNGHLAGTLAMDNLTYHYIAGTNKLDFVGDAVSGNPYGNDFPSGQSAGNYDYDKIGNLIKDTKENITNISWTVYGKIKQITKTTSAISFAYDASGNRVSKRLVNSAGDALTTFYVRDAQGNVMATYEENDPISSVVATTFAIKEQHLYGSSRIGVKTTNFDPSTANVLTDTYTRSLGFKNFELSNHLGNVLTVITDRKLAHTTTPTSGIVDYFSPEIVSSNDYYAFGMPMPGRSYQSLNGYRYGFNGKEKDDEVKGNGNSINYDARMLDTRLGQFLSIDPAQRKYPGLSPYSAFGNNPIFFKDNGGRTLEPGGNKTQALVDIQSLVPKNYQSQIKINDAGKIIFEGYDKLSDKVKQYEGISLVNNLISSKNDYQYIAGDKINSTNRETGAKQELEAKGSTPTFQEAITNLSKTPYGSGGLGDQENNLPADGFEGAVRISEGEFSSYSDMGTYISVSRKNVVFHELKENFLRTEGGDNKQGLDYNSAHKQAGDLGTKFKKETGGSDAGKKGILQTKPGDPKGQGNFERKK